MTRPGTGRAILPTVTGAVLFDFDYTLGESEDGIVLCANHALAAMGLPPAPRQAIRRTIGLTLEAMYERLTGRDGDEAAAFREAFIACADRHMTRHTTLYRGVPELLETLHGQGFALGVVTTKRSHRVREVLERHGLERFVAITVGIDSVPRPKPAPDGIRLAMTRLGADPSGTLFVGDSVVDGEAAARAGVPFAAVLTGATSRAELERWRPVAVLRNVTAVPPLLGALRRD